MYILGLNAYHGDSSAALLKDGELVVAQEEERIRRVKHWAGLPIEAIKFCLDYAGIGLDEVDYIAMGRDPQAHLWSKVRFTLLRRPSIALVWNRVKNLGRINLFARELAREFDVDPKDLINKLEYVEHHKAHLANGFFISPHEEAAVVSVDGMGDFVSAMWGTGRGNKIEVDDFVEFPHSLGYFYTAITQYLGFPNYGDEYKVMGLSAAGDPERYLDEMRRMVLLKEGGRFQLNLSYFSVLGKQAKSTWDGEVPTVGRFYVKKLEKLLGPARKKDEDLTQRHKDIAAACQAMYEEAFFHILRHVEEETEQSVLCLAGGTAQNSLANGKILENTDFEEVFIPPSAHDGGNSVGAAYWAWHMVQEEPRGFTLSHPFWGPEYSDEEIEKSLRNTKGLRNYEITKLDEEELIEKTAQLIADGNVVGWFQGRSEWGPRALGNRSILANPRRKDMKDIINRKIKYREPFRPFAPSILADRAEEYFTGWKTDPSTGLGASEISNAPFMERVYMIKEEKRQEIPAVTHLDGSGRLQTVERKFNSRYYDLIAKFGEITGTPVVLNTSFNENEPIVNTPEEAIDCFLRTDMDILVIDNYLVAKN